MEAGLFCVILQSKYNKNSCRIRQIVCQKDAERGLAHSALLIGENNNYVLLRFHDFTILLN